LTPCRIESLQESSNHGSTPGATQDEQPGCAGKFLSRATRLVGTLLDLQGVHVLGGFLVSCCRTQATLWHSPLLHSAKSSALLLLTLIMVLLICCSP
jgi:hypothetical protein